MKMGKPHIVPLSRQVVALFREQREETAHINTPWVFPNQVRTMLRECIEYPC